MKLLISMVFAVLLFGCATVNKQSEGAVNNNPVEKEVVISDPPVCKSDAECSVMWFKAIDQVQRISGMKIRLLTAEYAETYRPRQSYKLTGTVSKINNGDGTYIIKSNFLCGSPKCFKLAATAENLFNIMVKPSGSQ